MIHSKCLTLEEYQDLINNKFYNPKLNNPLSFIENAETWDTELIGLNFILSRILEIKNKQQLDTKSIIDFIYSLPDQLYFTIQEFGVDFIKFMLNKERPEGNITEMLIELQNDINERLF